jgi:glucoamylase
MFRSSFGNARFLRQTGRLLALTLFVQLLFADRLSADDLGMWLDRERATATSKMLGNILLSGAVMAAPSRQPDYMFHWTRDGALTTNVVYMLYDKSASQQDSDFYLRLLKSYADFSRSNQVTTNPRSEAGRGGGEPKFNLNGSAFDQPWGRPQDDGPALRILVLARLANKLLDGGQADAVAFVKNKLYDSQLPTSSVIKTDLEYVSNIWTKTCFDPWEEIRGHHFFTRLIQRRALIEGGKLADRLSDGGAATSYKKQAKDMETELARHWDDAKSYLVATLDRDDGIDYKASGLDTAVLLAVLYCHMPGDAFFSPTDDRVLATAERLVAKFKEIYPLNSAKTATGDPVPGVAMGRYPEDRYNGVNSNDPNGGNPWVLCTNGLAELYYRAAGDWKTRGQIDVTDRNLKFLKALDSSKFASLQSGQSFAADSQTFQDLLAALRAAGDAQLARTRYHANPDGSLSEQMNRGTGFMQSANDLTWSYASFLTALTQRSS